MSDSQETRLARENPDYEQLSAIQDERGSRVWSDDMIANAQRTNTGDMTKVVSEIDQIT